MRCIETLQEGTTENVRLIKSNMRCIETVAMMKYCIKGIAIKSNMRCIETSDRE